MSIPLLCLAACVTPVTAASDHGPWHVDLETATAAAQDQERDLLILFTGSDWCSPCQKLERSILSKPAFLDRAQERFVLVMLDFPMKRELSAARKAANDAAKERYAVRGFPTLVLARPDGSRYAATGFRRMAPDAYLAHLDELVAVRDREPELVAAVEAAEGPAEARARHALIEHRDATRSAPVTIADLEALLAADPDDTTGLCAAYRARRDREERGERLMAARRAGDLERIRAIVEEGLADQAQDGDYRQRLRYALAYSQMQSDKRAAVAEMERAIAENPEGDLVPTIQRIRNAMRRSLNKQ